MRLQLCALEWSLAGRLDCRIAGLLTLATDRKWPSATRQPPPLVVSSQPGGLEGQVSHVSPTSTALISRLTCPTDSPHAAASPGIVFHPAR